MARKEKLALPKPSEPIFSFFIGIERVDIYSRIIDSPAECYGYFTHSHSGCEIILDSRLSKEKFVTTLFHEVMHAIGYVLGAEMPHEKCDTYGSGLGQAFGYFIEPLWELSQRGGE